MIKSGMECEILKRETIIDVNCLNYLCGKPSLTVIDLSASNQMSYFGCFIAVIISLTHCRQ
jgi:hypothetical protein